MTKRDTRAAKALTPTQLSVLQRLVDGERLTKWFDAPFFRWGFDSSDWHAPHAQTVWKLWQAGAVDWTHTYARNARVKATPKGRRWIARLI